jgi:hypothetical protein
MTKAPVKRKRGPVMRARWRMVIPWVARVLYAPDYELDLIDKDGRPDHGKVMGLVIFAVLVTLMALRVIPANTGTVIVLTAAGFGGVMFRTFLRSRTVTSAETVTVFERPLTRQIDDPDGNAA